MDLKSERGKKFIEYLIKGDMEQGRKSIRPVKIASKLDISPQQLNNYRHTSRNIPDDIIEKLTIMFDGNMGYFIGKSDKMIKDREGGITLSIEKDNSLCIKLCEMVSKLKNGGLIDADDDFSPLFKYNPETQKVITITLNFNKQE